MTEIRNIITVSTVLALLATFAVIYHVVTARPARSDKREVGVTAVNRMSVVVQVVVPVLTAAALVGAVLWLVVAGEPSHG